MNVSQHIELARLRRKDEDERLPLCQPPATTSRLNGSLQMENVIWKDELFLTSLIYKKYKAKLNRAQRFKKRQ